MRSINAQLAADFAAGWVSTVAQVTRTDGTVQSFTDHDGALTLGSTVYVPAAGLAGIKLTITNNATVGTIQNRAAWLPVLSEADVLAGLYDNATISLGFISWKNPQYGILWVFSGPVGAIKASQDGFEATAQSAMWMLQRQLGIYVAPTCRHVLGSTVDPQGVGGCLLNLSPYTYTGTITALDSPMVWQVNIPNWNQAATPNTPNAPTASVQQNVVGQYLAPGTYHYSISSIDAKKQESSTSPITSVLVQQNNPPTGGGIITLNWSAVAGAVSYNIYGNTSQQLMANTTALTFSDNGASAQSGYAPLFGDYFALGILTMTSGAALGLSADVKTMRGSTLYTLLPLGRPVAVGDTFSITAGCSKTASACQYKFNNIVNFGGFPDLTPERQWQ